ncbi:MAG: hypothetical protein NZL96_02485 [Patescibacteria group bacterium]|nr:hypothetical protein [Patescibacteria group bacterium]
MKVTFIGKGGSGKTTLACLFVHYLLKKNKKILAVDADLNDHFGYYLGFREKPPAFGEAFFELADYIFGSYKPATFPKIGTIPPRRGYHNFQIDDSDWVIKKYTLKKGYLYYLNVGTYKEENVGNVCFHGKLNSLELYLNYLLEKETEFVVIDAMAGTDYLATSLYYSSDIYFFVIEPTLSSLEVFFQYLSKIEGEIDRFKIAIYPIANKIVDDRQLDFLKPRLRAYADNLIVFPFDRNYRRLEQTYDLSLYSQLIKNNLFSLEEVFSRASIKRRSPEEFYKGLRELFVRECLKWVNETYKQDFRFLIDPDFRSFALEN